MAANTTIEALKPSTNKVVKATNTKPSFKLHKSQKPDIPHFGLIHHHGHDYGFRQLGLISIQHGLHRFAHLKHLCALALHHG